MTNRTDDLDDAETAKSHLVEGNKARMDRTPDEDQPDAPDSGTHGRPSDDADPGHSQTAGRATMRHR